MSGSDFFEQELKERIQAYIMRPSGELWEKIEASLPVQAKRTMFFKRHVLLLAFLMLTISLSNDNYTTCSTSISKKQETTVHKLLVNTKSALKSNYLKNDIPEKYFSYKRIEPIGVLTSESSTVSQASSISLQKSIHVYDPMITAYTIAPTKLTGIATNLITNRNDQENKNITNSKQTEKDQEGLGNPKLKKRKGFLVYLSATLSYRSFNPKNKFNYANYGVYDNNNHIAHKPAFGWEAGFAFLKQIKPGIQLRSGLQFNYSRYTITASQGAPAFASLSVNSISTSQRISNLENRDGYKNQEYPNSSYQISVPVGMLIRLNKNPKSNLNIGFSVQPSYMVHASAFLLSSDYRNYVEAPDMLRRFNIFSGAELVYSKKIGQYHLLAGPQLRYQLLSRHKKEYSFRENLIDYGFKLGIARDLP